MIMKGRVVNTLYEPRTIKKRRIRHTQLKSIKVTCVLIISISTESRDQAELDSTEPFILKHFRYVIYGQGE